MNSAPSVDFDAAARTIEYCYEQGWTDGLPVVPPAPELVERFLAQTRRDRSAAPWRLEHLGSACTIQLAAMNAAMAGCLPEYFPVVLAALDAAFREGCPRMGAWQSTTGGAPLLIVNGPVRGQLGFNASGSVFGPGFRANATVGRAIRLIVRNAFGILPHELDQSSQGTPGQQTLCIAENEEESPWEPLQVDLGHAAETSTVSALHVRSCDFVDNRQTGDPRHVLNDIADTISRTGALMPAEHAACVILGPEHAQLLAGRGYSKRDVKEYLAEHSCRTYGDLRRTGRGSVEEPSGWRGPEPATHAGGEASLEERDAGELVRLIPSPDDVFVVVAGARNAGVSTVAQPFGKTLDRGHRGPGTSLVDDWR
ncbi:MAG: hypothetical protein KGJ86_02550 [Chloroflexota bacterium]|nr:hypothetical protein [Chloroflexota bacterium]